MAIATKEITAADELFQSAIEQIDFGDLRAASGTLWNATAGAFQALAAQRGWEVDKHRHYEDIYENAKRERPGNPVFNGMSAAVLMECNWLDDYELSERWVRHCADQIREMIDVLQEL